MICCPRCKDEPFPRIRIILDMEVTDISISNKQIGLGGLVRDWKNTFKCNKCELEALTTFNIWGRRTLIRDKKGVG
jgi:hypothetical protein